jgi:hypothetical protein
MKILVFGNVLVREDSLALRLIPKLASIFPNVEFKELDAAENVESEGKDLIILDVAKGIKTTSLIENLNSLDLSNIYSMHDFDIALTLKLLLKHKKINSIKIIALPLDSSEKEALSGAKKLISTLLSKSASHNSYMDHKL